MEASDTPVWPSAGFEGGPPGGVFNIELSSKLGQAHFEAPLPEISDFLRRTYRIVPAGEESDHLDVESDNAAPESRSGSARREAARQKSS